MKYKINQKVTLECTIDSSELVMMGEGGMYKVNIDAERMPIIDGSTDLEITFQLEGGHASRFKFVSGQKMQE